MNVYHRFLRAARNPLALLLVVTVSAAGLAVPRTPAAAADPEPIRYSYDDAGHLTSVTDPAADTATYAYDQAGNVTAVSRRASSQLSVLGVVPSRGGPGTSVTITGTGFSATAGNNTVTFAGTNATVSSASSTQLVVTVPSGATTGSVAVTSGSGTATAPQPFTVETRAAPTVAGFTPTSGASGTAVTITGTGFDPDPAGDVVLFNNTARARVTAATATTLTVLAPITGSGRIAVRTKNGAATSTDSFNFAPGSYALGDVDSYTKIDVDGAALAVTVGTASKIAVLRFEGEKGQRLSLGLTGKTFSGSFSLRSYTPTGVEMATSVVNAGPVISGDESRALPPLPATGTYQLVIDPDGTSTGSVTATLSTDIDAGVLSETNAGTAVTISRTGQRARLRLAGVQGQYYALTISANSGTASNRLWLYSPDGAAGLKYSTFSGGNGTIGTDALPVTGDYQVVIDVPSLATQSFTVSLAAAVDFGQLSATGNATTVTTARAGQPSWLHFDATQGGLYSLGFSAGTYSSFLVTVFQPDGSTLSTLTVLSAANELDLPSPTVSGSYGVLLAPRSGSTGSVTVTLATDVDAGVLSPTGAGTVVTTTRPGQNARMRFTGAVGQRVNLGFSGSTYGGLYWVTVYRPDGTVAVNNVAKTGSDDVDLDPLTVAGSYEVIIDPGSPRTGSLTVTVSTAEVDGGTLSLTGASSTVSIARPGQNARVRFTGAVGQRLSIGSTANTLGGSYYLTLLRPDGTVQLNNTSMSSGNGDLDLAPLTVAGTYEAVLNPTGGRTGSVTLTLSAELDGGVLSSTGAATTVSIARPGQNVRMRFTGAVGQHLSLGKTGATLNTSSYLTLLRPDGTTQLNNGLVSSGDDEVDFATLTVAGTYEVVFNPLTAGSGSATFTLAADVDGGALTVGGAAKTVTITRAGQNARLRFDGTVGQTLTLTFSGNTLSSLYYVSVLRPDGTAQISNKSLSGNTTLAIGALTVAGTHEIVINPWLARTGALTVALTTTTAAATSLAPGAVGTASTGTGGWWWPNLARLLPKSTTQAAQNAPGGRPVAGVSAHVPDGGWVPDKGNLAGLDWWTRQPKPASAPPALTAKRGVTALAGLVRGLDGRPLGGVSLRVDGAATTTRQDGRFLLTTLPAGHHELVVEANGIGRPAADYGHYVVGVDLTDGHTTVLPYTIWLTKVDRAQMVRFPSPTTGEVVLSTPKIPGLEVRIPAGTVVRDDKGQVVRELGITAIPTDRPPFPLPSQIHVPVYFSVQPGGSYLFPQGAQVIYPNYNHEPPGTRVEFWNYEPAGRGWYVYGHGSVTADGRQVVPDKDVRVYEFNGSMINSGLTGPGTGPNQDYRDWADGDPVDLGTGLLVDTHTDLYLPDVMPISLTRTYRQADSATRTFGIGQNFNYGVFLQSANEYQEADLILPDGGKIHYRRMSPGTGYFEAVFRSDMSPSEWGLSTLSWNGNGWDLTRRDGLTYVFGENAPLQAIRDRHGNQITLIRAGYQSANITQITSPGGKWIRLSYDTSNRVTRAEDNAGRGVGYTYDTAGWLKTVTDVAGKVTTYGYDADKRLTTIADPRGITYLTNTYDTAGRIARQVMPEGAVYQFDYTTGDSGRITETRVTDPNGHVRRLAFNADGFTISETAGYGTSKAQATTLVRQAGTNLVTRTTDQHGRATAYGYDAAGNVNSVTVLDGTPNKITNSTVYGGPFNQVSKVTDGLGHVTSYGFDPAGNVKTATDAVGRSMSFTYRPDGQLLTATDPAGKTTTFGYELGDRVSTTDPLGRVARQVGDAAGRIMSTIDPAGGIQRFSYDERNLVMSVTDGLGRSTSFSYDENGNRRTRTDARGHTTTWTYDDADRIKTTTDPLGKTSSNTYDAIGNPRTSTDRNGKVTRADYDELDRLATMAYGVSGSAAESTIGYTYDDGNRVTKIVDSATGTITQQPDELDRLTSQTTPQGTVTYGYDNGGRRRSMQVTGQPAVTYSYNDANQLTSMVKGNQTAVVDYDNAGRPRTRTLLGGASQTYGYDDANQVTSITYAQGSTALGTLTYSYDLGGRRASIGGSNARTNIPDAFSGATYNDADELTALAGKTYSYDNEGNLTGDGTTSYTWNARGQLSSMARTGLTASFAYDGLGRRTQKTVNTASTGYLYDGSDVVQELDGTSPTANLLTGGTDTHYARSDATGAHDMLTDALGSVVGLTDASGSVATKYTYDPFGATTSSGTASSNSAQYTGRENDGTGLYYYRARYYNPALQRFLSQDPAGDTSGGNLYAYAANSPTNFIDPSGNFAFLVVLAGEFLLGALIDGAISYGAQRLSGRKVDWGWHGVLGDAVVGGILGVMTAGTGEEAAVADDVADIAKFCRRNSFTPDTPVQMADGSTKPIGEVSIGDEVLATDPDTGQTGPRRVTDVIRGSGTKDLVDVTIDGHVITATANHPFYDTKRDTWVNAGDLRTGEVLRGRDGPVRVEKLKKYSVPDQTVFNLTVAGVHTYYVVAGDSPVLVHNVCGPNATGNPGRIAKRFGLSVRDVKDLIHRVKRDMPRDGVQRNPDVIVDLDTGEVYIKLPDGSPSHDSIGNILDGLDY